jgi:fucose permease
MKQKRLRFLIFTVNGLAFFLGVEAGGYQLVLLNIASDFVLSTTMMGVLVTSQYAAITIAPLAFGWMGDKIGKKTMLLIFMPVFTGGCFLAAFSSTVSVFLIGVFLIGVGYSVCECIGSAVVSDSLPGYESKYLNFMQAMFSIGAVTSPLFFNWLFLRGTFTWRLVFLVSGSGYVLLYPLMLLSGYVGPQSCQIREETLSLPKKPMLIIVTLFHSSFFVVLFFSMLAYAALETGITYFVDSFFVLEFADTRLGAYAISGFWFAMATVRIIFACTKIKPRNQVLWGFSSSAFLLIVLLFIRNQWLLLGIFIVLGATLGSVWPMIIGMGTSSYQDKSGTAASILTAGGGLGGALISVCIGTITEHTGLYGGFLLLAAISIIVFLVMIFGGSR